MITDDEINAARVRAAEGGVPWNREQATRASLRAVLERERAGEEARVAEVAFARQSAEMWRRRAAMALSWAIAASLAALAMCLVWAGRR